MKLIIGIILTLIAQTLVWFQINGQFKWEWFKENRFTTSLLFSIPISFLFVYSTTMLYEALGERVWTVRIFSFGSSILSFFLLSSLVLDEHLDLKNGICLSLAVAIIIIQVLWK